MNVFPKFDEFALILVRKLANSPISLAFLKRNVGWEENVNQLDLTTISAILIGWFKKPPS